jgi:hypothetical protein
MSSTVIMNITGQASGTIVTPTPVTMFQITNGQVYQIFYSASMDVSFTSGLFVAQNAKSTWEINLNLVDAQPLVLSTPYSSVGQPTTGAFVVVAGTFQIMGE